MLRGEPDVGRRGVRPRHPDNLDDLKKKIGEAAAAVGNTKSDANSQALDKAASARAGHAVAR